MGFRSQGFKKPNKTNQHLKIFQKDILLFSSPHLSLDLHAIILVSCVIF